MKKVLFCLTFLAVLLFMLAACSQSNSTPVATPTQTTTSANVPASTPPLQVAAAPARTYALPGDKVFPEGITYDPSTNKFFTGSTVDGTVFRGDLGSGQVDIFSAAGSDGRTAAIGMKADGKNRRLWVAGGATGLVFVYNIDNGQLIRKYITPQAEQTFLNDIALAPNGDAYITDSRRPVLFKIAGSAAQPGEMESWLDFTGTPVRFVTGSTALNGIVVTPDSSYVMVVHSTDQKLFRINVATKEVREIDLGGVPQGGDGMILDGQTLYVLTRTQTSDMIVRILMEKDFSRGAIQNNFRDDSFGYPTTIAKVGNRMLVVNSQFNLRGEGLTPKLPFTIADIPIPPSTASSSQPPAYQY